MKFLKLALIFAAFALFIIACTQNKIANMNVAENTAVNVNSTANIPQATTDTPGDQLASARKIYSEKCIKCHKEDGAGGVTTFDDGSKVKAPNFASDRKRKDKDEDWIETINNGAKEDGMPAYKGKIGDEDIKNLVKYIRREFQKS